MAAVWTKGRAVFVAAVLLSSAAVQARPAPDQPMDDRILHRQDLPYRFTTQDVDSADGQRHYRLWIAMPRRPAPEQGFPVAWLLDGNAALGALNADLLQQLAQGAAPVLVAVGSPIHDRIDRAGRTLDYTPRLGHAPDQRDPLTGLPSGGADAFLDVLETRIKPAVAGHVPLDARRQTLWGHSYGGLLVLHALFTRPQSFQTFAAASPSLWWGQGAVLDERQGLARRLVGHQATVLLMRGGQEPAAPPRMKLAPQAADQASRSLYKSFQGVTNLDAYYRVFPDLNHGPMLAASLRYTLLWLNRQP